MVRKDGLTRVFKMFLGDIVYKIDREKTDNVLVKAIQYIVNDDEFTEIFVVLVKIIGAIDIGSNANRINCARLTPDRRIEIAKYVRTILGLGLEIFKLEYLQKSIINNLVRSLEIFCRNFQLNFDSFHFV